MTKRILVVEDTEPQSTVMIEPPVVSCRLPKRGI
jgi:hypothetical protein